MRPPGCCAPWSTTPFELIATARWLSSADGLRGPSGRERRWAFRSVRDQRPHLPAAPGKVDPCARRTASLGSSLGPLGTGRSYSSERMGINRGCPWMTAADRCVGHVGGTAGEDGGARSLVRWPPARPQGEAVLDDHVPRWQALRRRRSRYCGDIHRHQPIHATPTVLIAVTVGNHRIDLRCGLLSLDPPKRLCALCCPGRSKAFGSRWAPHPEGARPQQ